jgi:hypothetical protein
VLQALWNSVTGLPTRVILEAEMTTKKTKLDAAVRKTAAILEDHLSSLPPAEAKAMLREIHTLVVKSSRSTNRATKHSSPLA